MQWLSSYYTSLCKNPQKFFIHMSPDTFNQVFVMVTNYWAHRFFHCDRARAWSWTVVCILIKMGYLSNGSSLLVRKNASFRKKTRYVLSEDRNWCSWSIKLSVSIITNFRQLSRQSFGPKFCVVWPRKMPASGWGSLCESSSFVPWFSTFVLRNVPRTVSKCVRICWFERNSSNLVRAPKMRDSVLLYSWDSFLVTLPSISSKTCAIYSSLILGTDVFRDWPFLGFSSCVSLVTAANFRFFLNVSMFLKGKCYSVMKTELFCIC